MGIHVELQIAGVLLEVFPADPASPEDLVLEAEVAQNEARLEQGKKVGLLAFIHTAFLATI